MKEIHKSNVLSFLKKKTLVIFVPFLSWTFLVKPLFFIDKFTYYGMNEFISAFTHPWLWFLLTLFFYDIIYGMTLKNVAANICTDFHSGTEAKMAGASKVAVLW